MTAGASGTALVTGGAVRVGRAIALALAEAGFDVAITYRRSEDAAAETVREIETLGVGATALSVDLSEPAAAPRVLAAIRAELGPLDVLVNSAATFEPGRLDDADAASFDRQMAVNVRTPLLLAREAAGDLRRHGSGRVVNVGDLAGERPFREHLIHSVTKAALLGLTRSLARELAPEAQVHAVVPGTVDAPPDWPAERVERVVRRTPMGRSGSPADVGEAVRFLATCSSFSTGSVLHVDGGAHLSG